MKQTERQQRRLFELPPGSEQNLVWYGFLKRLPTTISVLWIPSEGSSELKCPTSYGSIDSTTEDCSIQSAIFQQRSSKNYIMPSKKTWH